ncbi:MAG: XdhC family protein, partial [Candidatus Rokuibacteriota bacterium]
FALATVVRCEAPTSAKPGAKALILEDGTVQGWVGGACAEPVVLREALQALRDGRPRLIGLYGEGGRAPGRAEGMLEYGMTCHSGGTLEIYVEPYLPKPMLVLVGHGPVIDTLATLGRAADFLVVPLAPDALPVDLQEQRLTGRASVVVATHAESDEDALDRVLRTDAGYVSLVASRRRAAVILERLEQRGVPPERRSRLRAPAGLDIGAVTPEEIAVSILAEIIQHRRSEKTTPSETEPAAPAARIESKDPICGMIVDGATTRFRSEFSGRAVYFCCRHCKEMFDQDPERYRAVL